jgi:hypothetical protein
MKNTIISRSTIILPILLGLAVTSQAAMVLNLTEVSSTTLTYSWNGGAVQTVIATTPDHWSFVINDAIVTPVSTLGDFMVQWKEPEYATSFLVNWIHFYQYGPAANGTAITVISDNPLDPQHTYPTMDNGQSYIFPIQDGNTVTFNDRGDTVPEPTTFIAGAMLLLPFGASTIRMLRKTRTA